MSLGGPYTTEDSLGGILAGLDVCLGFQDAESAARSAPEVSAWSVVEHIEHLALADRGILGWVASTLGDPSPSEAEDPNPIGVQILQAGAIPRGRGPAPPFALPGGLDHSALMAELRDLRAVAAGLDAHHQELDASRHTRPHHVLGHFNPPQWLRFLHIHHAHHEAIVRDILAG